MPQAPQMSLQAIKSPARVLSIQSHVVRGYVGNKAAVFPLQLLGHHVDAINTVQFTSMYVHEGAKIEGAALRRILDTIPLAQRVPGPDDHPGPLRDRGAIDVTLPVDYRYLLTGYVASVSVIEEIVRFVKNQKAIKREKPSSPDSPREHPQFLWICDPVMGDNGKPYVAAEVVQAYKSAVVPLADILTPNQFELEWLCDRQIYALEDAVQCCRDIHARGPRIVVVTSIAFPKHSNGEVANKSEEATENEDEMILLASQKMDDGNDSQFIIRFPRLNVYLGGTGDLMAAMILHGLDEFEGKLDLACEKALAVLQGVITKTVSYQEKWHEVDVIGSRSEILHPTMKFQSSTL